MKKEDMLRLLSLADKPQASITEAKDQEYTELIDMAGEDGLHVVWDGNGHRPHIAIFIPEWDAE